MSSTPRHDPIKLPDGIDMHEYKTKGLVIVMPLATALRKTNVNGAVEVTIPWPVLIASARRCRPKEFSKP